MYVCVCVCVSVCLSVSQTDFEDVFSSGHHSTARDNLKVLNVGFFIQTAGKKESNLAHSTSTTRDTAPFACVLKWL